MYIPKQCTILYGVMFRTEFLAQIKHAPKPVAALLMYGQWARGSGWPLWVCACHPSCSTLPLTQLNAIDDYRGLLNYACFLLWLNPSNQHNVLPHREHHLHYKGQW